MAPKGAVAPWLRNADLAEKAGLQSRTASLLKGGELWAAHNHFFHVYFGSIYKSSDPMYTIQESNFCCQEFAVQKGQEGFKGAGNSLSINLYSFSTYYILYVFSMLC